MIIKPIEKEDIEVIALIERECFSHPWSARDIEESMNADCVFFIAKEDKEALGYVGIQISDGGYITNVAVLKSARKKGVGKALMEKAIEYIKEKSLPFLTLEVRISNAPAITLYEKIGMKNLGKRPNFYSDPKEDAFIYTLYF